MKKLFALLLAAVMMFAGAGGHCFAAAETTVSIWLDGEKIVFPDAQPILADARVLVPVRGFFEKIGVTVDWNPKSRMVIIKDDAREIMMEAGNRAVLNNGAVEYLDCSVLIKDNRAYIPIRYISENFGCKVQWDGKTRSVYVTRTSADASGDPDEASELPTVGDLESLY
ncbi:MAG TPA: copper amine oxidase N-terminal domain-containing protein, partial [Clostridia bacterium]